MELKIGEVFWQIDPFMIFPPQRFTVTALSKAAIYAHDSEDMACVFRKALWKFVPTQLPNGDEFLQAIMTHESEDSINSQPNSEAVNKSEPHSGEFEWQGQDWFKSAAVRFRLYVLEMLYS